MGICNVSPKRHEYPNQVHGKDGKKHDKVFAVRTRQKEKCTVSLCRVPNIAAHDKMLSGPHRHLTLMTDSDGGILARVLRKHTPKAPHLYRMPHTVTAPPLYRMPAHGKGDQSGSYPILYHVFVHCKE